MSAFIFDYFKDHPAEIQVDSTGLVEYSYKPTDVLIESLKFKFLSLPIEQRVKAGLQDTQWLRYPEDVDEAARGLAMPSFENLDLMSEHKADRINYRYDTLVLTYELPIDDDRSCDFHATKLWKSEKGWEWTTKAYFWNYALWEDSVTELLSGFGIQNFEIATQFGIGVEINGDDDSPFEDIYFYLRGDDCATIWERLGFQRRGVRFEDNRGKGLFAVTVKDQKELVKLKRYYYPDDVRLEKPWC